MRIHNDAVSTSAASQAAQAESVAQSGSKGRLNSTGATGGDQVQISSLSGNLASSNAALASQQSSRVSHLAALYAKGNYDGNAAQISKALVAGAITSGSVGAEN